MAASAWQQQSSAETALVTHPQDGPAERDLDEIWFHIALDNIAAADALLDTVDQSCRKLAGQAMLRRARPELAPELRSFAVRRYVVFYLPMPEGISVIRVLHGARDISLLADQGGFEP